MEPILIAAGLGAAYLLFGKSKPKLPPGISPGGVPAPPSAYSPPAGPPSLSELDQAKQMAPDIESDLKTNGINYDHAKLREFQRLVRLAVDGMYGPRTAGALEWALGHQAPPAIFKNLRSRTLDTIPYSPASA
jgi:hypothetical protein